METKYGARYLQTPTKTCNSRVEQSRVEWCKGKYRKEISKVRRGKIKKDMEGEDIK